MSVSVVYIRKATYVKCDIATASYMIKYGTQNITVIAL